MRARRQREPNLRRHAAPGAQSRRARSNDDLRRRQPANRDLLHRMTLRDRMRTALRGAKEEDGFTLIEVLVGAIVLTLAAMGTFGMLAAATRNAQRAQATQVALDKAQEEMEKLHSLSYTQLALTTLPLHQPSPKNPNFRVDGKEFALEKNLPDDFAEM